MNHRSSAIALAVIMMFALLVMFVPGRAINPSLFQTCIFLLAAGWAAVYLYRPFPLHWNVVLAPIAASAAWGIFQAADGRTVNRWNTWMAVLAWCTNLLACFLAMQFTSARARHLLLRLLVRFAFGLSVVSLLQYYAWNGQIFWLYPSHTGPLLGPFENRDHYAAFIELVLPIALLEAMSDSRRALHYAVLAATLYASAIAGGSRAGALLLTAEAIAVPLIAWAKRDISTAPLPAAVGRIWLLIFFFGSIVGWTVLWHRFHEPQPLRARQELLRDTAAMIRARPYFGVGLGNFSVVHPAFSMLDFEIAAPHAHNDWAEWAADGGIPFAGLMLLAGVWAVRRAIASPWAVGLIAILLHAAVDYPLQVPVLDLWFFVLLGLLAAQRCRSSHHFLHTTNLWRSQE